MKKALTVIISFLFVLSLAGFGFAAKDAPVKVKSITGKVTAVDATAGTLTVKSAKQEVLLSTNDKTSIKIGKENKTLADIKSGNEVKVKYTEVDGKNVAESIAAKAAPKKITTTKKK
jgi:5'-3' exonuclease